MNSDGNKNIIKVADTVISSPFIHKYQPTYFRDFEQLDPTTITLMKSLISLNNLNILIIGDSGTGKTSIINSIIKEYYGNDYNYDNVLILNSLKEQGIQYYRNDVKIFCQTCSLIKNKKKIVLLDDIDLINEQSQQVFRNCMDKYKHNIHFISSCTNLQKVIDSLQSRTILVQINPLTMSCLTKIMNKIKINEKLNMSSDADEFILSICNNSVRILINYLEKIRIINCYVDMEMVNKLCTNISYIIFDSYTNCVLNKNLTDGIKILYNLHDEGYSVMDILDNYFLYIKLTNLLNDNIKYKLTTLVCKYIIYFHNVHEDELELALFTNNFMQLFSC
uniref:AAA+ ATPase domain-containing protein n=1 Tax=viral metagenome TaxID=1070528 RepID=A0A6C0F186_9ZZZZ